MRRNHTNSEKDYDSILNFPALCLGPQDTQLFFVSQAQNPFKGQSSTVVRDYGFFK